MIQLDNFGKWADILDESARKYLDETELQEYQSIAEPDRLDQLKDILERPIAHFSPVNEVFFRAKWAEVLETVHPGQELTLLEVASGDADMIPQVMARVRPHSRYISANMNRILTTGLRRRTRNLPIDIQVFEEDAARINQFLAPESVDIIAFQHGVNDVIQAILCDREGVDTTYADWMETLPQMIRILQKEIAQKTLEQHARGAFLALLEKLFRVLKPGGTMAMNHYMFQLDLDWGYPPDLWENIIPMTREWCQDQLDLKEAFYEGFEPQWWLFYQKL